MHVNVCIDMFCSAGSMSPVGNRSSCLPQYHDANGYSETQATYGFPTKVFLPFAAHRPSQPSYSLKGPTSRLVYERFVPGQFVPGRFVPLSEKIVFHCLLEAGFLK